MEVDAAPGSSSKPASPMYNYVVTAQPPTAVTQAVVGHFTGPADVNLILGCVAAAQEHGRDALSCGRRSVWLRRHCTGGEQVACALRVVARAAPSHVVSTRGVARGELLLAPAAPCARMRVTGALLPHDFCRAGSRRTSRSSRSRRRVCRCLPCPPPARGSAGAWASISAWRCSKPTLHIRPCSPVDCSSCRACLRTTSLMTHLADTPQTPIPATASRTRWTSRSTAASLRFACSSRR
jgi:hypothetical protein